jgi:hypothetical protein
MRWGRVPPAWPEARGRLRLSDARFAFGRLLCSEAPAKLACASA